MPFVLYSGKQKQFLVLRILNSQEICANAFFEGGHSQSTVEGLLSINQKVFI